MKDIASAAPGTSRRLSWRRCTWGGSHRGGSLQRGENKHKVSKAVTRRAAAQADAEECRAERRSRLVRGVRENVCHKTHCLLKVRFFKRPYTKCLKHWDFFFTARLWTHDFCHFFPKKHHLYLWVKMLWKPMHKSCAFRNKFYKISKVYTLVLQGMEPMCCNKIRLPTAIYLSPGQEQWIMKPGGHISGSKAIHLYLSNVSVRGRESGEWFSYCCEERHS